MRKKAALAIALVHNPRVLFLDQPFEGIDPGAARTIRSLLADIARRGITVFFTSHLIPMLEQLATEIMLLKAGRIVWQSPGGNLPRSIETLYFDFIESSVSEDLAWLRLST